MRLPSEKGAKSKEKSSEPSVSEDFLVRVLITDLENISPAGIPVPYTIWII